MGLNAKGRLPVYSGEQFRGSDGRWTPPAFYRVNIPNADNNTFFFGGGGGVIDPCLYTPKSVYTPVPIHPCLYLLTITKVISGVIKCRVYTIAKAVMIHDFIIAIKLNETVSIILHNLKAKIKIKNDSGHRLNFAF